MLAGLSLFSAPVVLSLQMRLDAETDRRNSAKARTGAAEWFL